MRPLKFLNPFAVWLLRAAVVLFAYTFYLESFVGFNLQSVEFYVATAFLALTTSLFLGGFFQHPGVTVLSALLLCLVTGHQIVILLLLGVREVNYNLAAFIVLGAVFGYFASAGNPVGQVKN